MGKLGDLMLGIKCEGCDTNLSVVNVGGYRAFCHKCVTTFPEFPEDGNEKGGCHIEGRYPNYKWVCGPEDSE